MTPDDLTRRLHDVIDTAISDSLTVEIDRAVGRAEIEACEAERREAETVRDEVTAALRRLADVLDLADDVTSYRSGHVGTHYEDCYRHHAGCFAARIQATARGESSKPCGCYQCIQHEIRDKQFPHNTVQFMVICESCGNKRCPHAEHHDNPCTGSNEPGQPGAVRYPEASRESRPLSKEEFFARMDEITGHLTASGETNEKEAP